VEITIERDGVGLALIRGAEVAEEGTDVVPFDARVSGDPVGQVLEVARTGEVAQPLWVEDIGVEAVHAQGGIRKALS
jgi:hypothetical protein